MFGGFLFHCRRVGQRQCIGADQSVLLAQSQDVLNRLASPFRLIVPQGTINIIACAAGGENALQTLPIQPVFKLRSQAQNIGKNTLNRLIIARIGHTFPAPGMHTVAHGNSDHTCFGARPAGNRKHFRERKDCFFRRDMKRRFGHIRRAHPPDDRPQDGTDQQLANPCVSRFLRKAARLLRRPVQPC